MGTVVTARATASDEATARRAVAAAFAEMSAVERATSYEDPASELNRVNRDAAASPAPASPVLFDTIRAALGAARATGGYFDPTVGPLVDLYGIKTARPRWPSAAEVAATLSRVGYDKVVLDEWKRTVSFTTPGTRLDLSGIAPGWAADRAAAAMAAAGARAGIVDAGGEVACFGDGPRAGGRWRIGIKNPRGEGLYGYVDLGPGKMACATTGDYEQRYAAGGYRFSHLFDPHTGRPASYAAGVTVVAPSCAVADAWATALAVMPPAQARAALKRPGAPAALIIRDVRGKTRYERYGSWPDLILADR
jgi:thiamine biosynthesis lipoprotein